MSLCNYASFVFFFQMIKSIIFFPANFWFFVICSVVQENEHGNQQWIVHSQHSIRWTVVFKPPKYEVHRCINNIRETMISTVLPKAPQEPEYVQRQISYKQTKEFQLCLMKCRNLLKIALCSGKKNQICGLWFQVLELNKLLHYTMGLIQFQGEWSRGGRTWERETKLWRFWERFVNTDYEESYGANVMNMWNSKQM